MIIDAKAIVIDGVPFTVKLFPDSHYRLDDADCYDETNRRFWAEDMWRFVGVVVVNEFTGQGDSVWGVEYGILSAALSVTMADIASRDDIHGMCRGLL